MPRFGWSGPIIPPIPVLAGLLAMPVATVLTLLAGILAMPGGMVISPIMKQEFLGGLL